MVWPAVAALCCWTPFPRQMQLGREKTPQRSWSQISFKAIAESLLVSVKWEKKKKMTITPKCTKSLNTFGFVIYVVSSIVLIDHSLLWTAVQLLQSNTVTWMCSIILNHKLNNGLLGKADIRKRHRNHRKIIKTRCFHYVQGEFVHSPKNINFV